MADKRTVRTAYNKASSKAFHDADPEGSWSWRPSAFEASRLGYEAAEAKFKNKEPTK